MGIFSFVKPGKQIYKTITSVKPAVGKSKLQKAVDSAKLEGKKLKGKTKKFIQKMEQDIDPARVKLRQTMQKLKGEKVTESGVSKGKDLIKKAKGGRVGLKRGTGLMKKKSNVQKIKETFSPKKKKFPDLTGDGKVTFADILKGRGVINGKKKKKVI